MDVKLGILTLIPPLLAMGLAIKTKDVIISLLASVVVGGTFVCGFNPYIGGLSILRDYVFPSVADSTNAQAIIMMIVIGGFTELLTKSGGALAFTNKVTKGLNSRAKCETAMWLAGLFVWFTDVGNSLIVGPIFDKIGERLKVSREKFSYILDCTTSPICALIPIVGFGIYIMGLIDVELKAAAITGTTGWDVFLSSAPFNFYTVLTLGMCGFVAMTQFDFGTMLKAQMRAKNEGKTIRDGGVPMRRTKEVVLPEGVEPRVSTMAIPLVILLFFIFFELIRNGFPFQALDGTIIRTAIMFGFLVAEVALVFLCVKNKILPFQKCMDTIIEGMSGMMYMSVVLVLAWALGGICKGLGTADYLVQISQGFLNPGFLPAILFIIGACMSLATGTSWGTMAILMPIGFPMALSMGVSIPVTVGAVISGGLFGDHVSPISDTTILASMGSASDHIDHFATQMPYALVVAGVSAVAFAVSGWYESTAIMGVGALVLFAVIYLLHRIDIRKYQRT